MRDDDARRATAEVRTAFHARLEVLGGPQKGEFFDLGHAPFRLGRDRSCEVHLVDPESVMSGTHAVVEAPGGRPSLVDKSLNGTELLRGPLAKKLQLESGGRVALEDGDVIVLTPTICVRFRVVAAPEADASRVERREAPQSVVAAPAPQAAQPSAKPDRKKLLYVGVAMFWLTVFAAFALQGDPAADPAADDAAFLAAVLQGDPEAPTVKPLAARIGPAQWKTLHEYVVAARLEEGRGATAAATRSWTRTQLWARARLDAETPDLARIVRESERRVRALDR